MAGYDNCYINIRILIVKKIKKVSFYFSYMIRFGHLKLWHAHCFYISNLRLVLFLQIELKISPEAVPLSKLKPLMEETSSDGL